MLDDARATIMVLPPEEAGTCVLDAEGDLLRIVPGELRATLASGRVHFHRGTIRGAMPRLT